MKRLFLSLFCLTALLFPGGAMQAEDLKVGLVDFARIQQEYWRTDDERTRFETERDAKMKMVEERRAQMDALIQVHQTAHKKIQDPTLSQDMKNKIGTEGLERRKQIASLDREIAEMESGVQKDLATKANTIQRSLTKEIYDVIGEVAEAMELDFALNRTFGINGVPTVAYSSTKRLPDFSDEVIVKLNANAPPDWKPKTTEGEAEATEAPAAPAPAPGTE
ncbi:MAG: Skp family chaperone for outer membrane protein [Verrucomicrobiales bacterium]|jgi:Skp family chaperone for outer membrane proteins